MNEVKYISKSYNVVNRSITYFASITNMPLWVLIVIVSSFSTVGAAYGAYTYFSSHMQNDILPWVFGILAALVSEAAASWFFYNSFSALFSKKFAIAGVFVALGFGLYVSVTYQATKVGFETFATEGDKTEVTYLTYKTELDSLVNAYNTKIDTLNAKLAIHYVKQSEIANNTDKYTNADRKTNNNIIATLNSQLTNMQAEKSDRVNELKKYSLRQITEAEQTTEGNKSTNFNYALITLVLVPLLYFFLVLMHYFCNLENNGVDPIAKILKENSKLIDEVAHLKKNLTRELMRTL